MNKLPKYPVGTTLQTIYDERRCTIVRYYPDKDKGNGKGKAYDLHWGWDGSPVTVWTQGGIDRQLSVIHKPTVVHLDEELFII